MSKAVYVGVDNKARKVKSLYVGVDGVARKVKKGYIGVNGVARLFYAPVDRPPRLPAGYDELEYIYTEDHYSTYAPGPYIDTGIKPHRDTKVIVKAQAGTDISSFTGSIVYSHQESSQYYIAEFRLRGANSTIYFNANYDWLPSDGIAGSTVTIATDFRDIFEVTIQGDGNCSVNGIQYKSHGLPEEILYMTTMALGPKEHGDSCELKLFGCQIYASNELVRDYVPCKTSTNMIGMYDLVNNSFSSSASSAQFLAGPNIF